MKILGVRTGRALIMSMAALTVGIPLGVGLDAPSASAATITLATCLPAELITDINLANATTGDTLSLEPGCTYDLTTVDNSTDGPTGLPVITSTMTIEGHGDNITRDAANSTPDFRIFDVREPGNLTLDDLMVTNGNATSNPAGDAGGDIYNLSDLTVSNSTISGGVAQEGGGIFAGIFTTTTVTNSTISSNFAEGVVGSVCFGAGIESSGDLTITSSTISGNQVGNGCGAGDGGGIAASGTQTTISNSTLSGNTATDYGGAIQKFLAAIIPPATNTVDISSSTIDGNSAVTGGGVDNDAAATLTDSILADNTGSDCADSAVTDGGYNDTDDTSCFGATSPTLKGSLTGNAAIGTLSLGANGSTGPETEAINATSSAFNLVAAGCPATDERGDPRPGDASQSNCDAGAFELQVTQPPTIAKAFGASSIELNGITSLTFTITNPNATASLSGIGFSDTFPSGLEVAPNPIASSSCDEAMTGATAGSTTVGLDASPGGSLDAGDSCTVSVEVTATAAGAYTNNSGDITSTEGGIGGDATADLTVIAPPTLSKAFGASSMDFGQSTSLTFTLTNPNATGSETDVAFSDALPAGLSIVPAPPSVTCNGNYSSTPNSLGLTGSTILADSSCTITVSVVATGVGNQVNLTSDISSTSGGQGTDATASIMVNPAPLDATISGSELWAFPPSFNESISLPNNVGVEGDPSCSDVDGGHSISSLPDAYATYTLESSSCGGLTLTGSNAEDYVIDYVGGDFSVYASGLGITPAPLPPGAPSATYGPPTSAAFSTRGGATITVNSGGATVVAIVPPGALPPGTFVSLFPAINPAGVGLPASQSFISSFAVSWFLPGSPAIPTATLPITLSITDASINSSSLFYQETTGGLVPVTGVVSGDTVTFSFTGDPAFVVANPATSTPAPTQHLSGSYDLVGSDGGVFAFGSSPFYGSLPGLRIAVHNIVGIVPTSTEQGYYLVGSDGGVFAFGDATFEKSLPQLGVAVNDIVGIIPTKDDKGYFLVGKDGGVFSFGDAPFENSLPGEGIHVDNIVGIAATSDDAGYWLVSSSGVVYALGDAKNLGSAPGGGIVSIAATNSGDGYWLTGANGVVYPLGDAKNESDLPALGVGVSDIVSLIPSQDDLGYLLIGKDGGVFAFGDASYPGSLPGIGVHVNNIVGAVSTG